MQNPASAPIKGYSGPADTTLQQYWLDVAWRALQGEDRTLVARIGRAEVETEAVADVVTAAARRVLRNPDGRKVESGSIDDYQESATHADATEDVYFTAAELRRIQSSYAATMTAGSLKYC